MSSVSIFTNLNYIDMKKRKESEFNRRASFITDALIAETVYDPVAKLTKFAVFDGNEVGYKDFLETDLGPVYPLDAHGDMVCKGVVLLPSKASEYGTEPELIEKARSFIHRYLEISPEFEQIAAYYVPFTWLYDRFYELPYLRAIGDYGSGKSRFLQTIGSICCRPIFTGGATTTAPIFRTLDEIKGTLILDEADMRFSDKTIDIIKILNMGYQKGGTVLRMRPDSEDVRAFDVFSPKIIGMREMFSDRALESRFLSETMGRTTLRPDIPIRLGRAFDDDARELRNQFLMWRFRNYRKELVFEDTPIEGLHPRLRQIITPLMAVMDSVEAKEALKAFAKAYNTELVADRSQTREYEIILAIFQLKHKTGKKTLTVGEIAEHVNWGVVDERDRVTAKKVGWWMSAKLQLKAPKMRDGHTLDLKHYASHLDFWKSRLGISDEDIQGEHVNDVNIVNNEEDTLEELTAEDVGF